MFSLLGLVSLIGALMNRVLGGGLDRLDQWDKRVRFLQNIGGTGLFLIVFFLVMLFAGADKVALTGEGVPVYNLALPAFVSASLVTLGMWLGSTWGWGRYVGALGGWEDERPTEMRYIDWLTEKAGLTPQYEKINKSEKVRYLNIAALRKWGFVSVTLRGGLWGACVSLFTLSFMPLFGGLFMGVVYLVGIEFCRKVYSNPNRGWPLSEWLWGAWFWPWCVLAVV